ncbi:hypothetical protein KFE98_08565 [bacterium SCSIO 12741]|nr:hypothetical protein KFE98_08565 [bacterium SCSIO 12741]
MNRRLVLALFCFVAYYFTQEGDLFSQESWLSGDFLFFMGLGILALSVGLMFILFLETKLEKDELLLDGLWTARRVKIKIKDMAAVKKAPYSRFYLNRPVYNLHRKGKIKFYCHGRNAVRITLKDGTPLIIGTQKPDELYQALFQAIQSKG